MGKNKLSETQVREIIEWVISSPLNGVQVAAKYSISPVQLRAILHLRAWPHLLHSADTITRWRAWLADEAYRTCKRSVVAKSLKKFDSLIKCVDTQTEATP